MGTINLLSICLSFAFIMMLANRAEMARLRATETSLYVISAYSIVVVLQLALFLGGIGIQAAGLTMKGLSQDELPVISGYEGFDLTTINYTLLGAGLWVPALIGMLVLLPPVRRIISRLIPIESPNHVHAIAMSLATLALTNMLGTVGIGLENLTANIQEPLDPALLIETTWTQNLGMFIIGLVGVGLLSRRSWREVLARLKLQSISLREVGIGFMNGIGALIILGGAIALGNTLGFGNPEVDALSEEIFGPFFQSIGGILTVGLAAAWGEETIFRGALQPKFGRFLTAVLFATIHGNYGFSIMTIAILIIGYVLGIIRDRYNTTTAMVTHATFNSVQALLAYLVVQYGLTSF